ncbi:MAG TPA: transketolase C-terminal domain-containing protein [Atribacteraceae bacterium]|nr:transketolase C-terminal domain-containing protein [Atribacteraceae bacterium]
MELGKKAGLKPGKPMRDVFGDALLAVAQRHPRVVVLDGDLGNSTKADRVRTAFPERYFNIGIAESNLVGIGAGLESCGFIPFLTSFSSFLLCNAYDQIRLAVAMSNANIKILGSHGGITLGKDGPTQMGIEDLALVGGLPTVLILVASDPTLMHKIVDAAVEYQGPVFIRSSRMAMPHLYSPDSCPFEIGVANVVRDGEDLAIVACGIMVAAALDAAVDLAREEIDARVIDLHTLRPLDVQTLEQAARETGALVCAEEHLLQGGMGANVARVIAERWPVPIRFVGLADTYTESAEPGELLKKYHLTTADIVSACRQAVRAKKEQRQ